MNRQNFGKWGIELKPEEFAGALAFLLQTFYERTPDDILAKLTGVEDLEKTYAGKEIQDDVLIPLCFDSTYHFKEIHFWANPDQWQKSAQWLETPAEIYYHEWERYLKNLKEEHEENEWKRYEKSNSRLEPRPFRLRIELYTNSENASWLISQLSQLNDNEVSIYVRTDEPGAEVGWNWALTVGFLPDENSQRFRSELKEYIEKDRTWLKSLVEFINLDSENDACDLLVIPESLRSALKTALTLEINISADCVLIIGSPTENPADVPSLINTFRRLIKTSGVGLVYVSPQKRTDWFAEFIRELSHNESIDAALFAACREAKTPTPLLIASRRLIEFSKLAESIKSFGEKIKNITVEKKIDIDSEDAWNFGIEKRSYDLQEMSDVFVNDTNYFRFDRESSSAASTTRIKNEVEKILTEKEASKKNEARWIQTQVYDLSRPNEPVRLRRALRASAPHEAFVRIGLDSKDWEKSDEEFKSDLLPTNKESYKLTVVFTEPQLLDEPQVASVVLPPLGNSSECRFFFRVRENVNQIEARITVLYKNRVLQTALLKALVASEPLEASEKNRIELTREAIVRADFSGLKDRRHFDAAFILNHDVKNIARVTAIKDDYVSFSTPSGLPGFVAQVNEFITQIADSPIDYRGQLNTPATLKLITNLAKYGRILYDSLVENEDGTTPLANIIVGLSEKSVSAGNPKRIQIISANPDARLPFEFLYDREAPQGDEAEFCPNVVAALERGKCFDACPGLSSPKDYVCPMGFWGLSNIIERHTHSNLYSTKTVDGDFRFQSEPVKERRHLNIFKKVLFAASDKADALEEQDAVSKEIILKKGAGIQKIISSLNGITNSVTDRISSWDEWREKIKSETPPTALILITHTEPTGGGILALEIGDGKRPNLRLEMSGIGQEYVRFPAENLPPIVLLIGCETGEGKANIQFANFVARFRQGGAAIIVSTGATILGRHAIPVTNELLERLNEYTKKPNLSFGEVMRVVKQRMLARGFPMVLTLMAYGDADWQIGTRE